MDIADFPFAQRGDAIRGPRRYVSAEPPCAPELRAGMTTPAITQVQKKLQNLAPNILQALSRLPIQCASPAASREAPLPPRVTVFGA